MTRAGSAAEPSMEEILASIRRIISDGDEGSEREGDSTMNQAVPADAPPAPHRPAEIASGVSPAQADSLGRPPEETKNNSAEDEVFELTDEMLAEMPGEETSVGVASPEVAPQPATNPEAGHSGSPLSGMQPVEPKQPDLTFADVSPNSGSAKQTATPLEKEPAAASAGNDHLLSPAADAQVTAAFNHLASTILMKDARTLDDLVQDMLRPMLKEWLDDNLPQLVERLVREEIQRVSRGRG